MVSNVKIAINKYFTKSRCVRLLCKSYCFVFVFFFVRERYKKSLAWCSMAHPPPPPRSASSSFVFRWKLDTLCPFTASSVITSAQLARTLIRKEHFWSTPCYTVRLQWVLFITSRFLWITCTSCNSLFPLPDSDSDSCTILILRERDPNLNPSQWKHVLHNTM